MRCFGEKFLLGLARVSELYARMKRDHTHRAIGAQPDAEKPGRRRDSIGERPEPGLRGRFSWNAG